MTDFKRYKDTVYEIIDAAMKVHSELNGGLLEPLYNEALHLELNDRGIANQSEQTIPCFYKNHKMEKEYRMDIVVGDIVVELKSAKKLIPQHRAQLFNYMRLTKRPIGLLINFGQTSLQGERYAWIKDTNECIMLDKDMNLLHEEIESDYEYNPYEDEPENNL